MQSVSIHFYRLNFFQYQLNMATKRCFVVMGFGIKTDLATGRKLNLDKSYQALIKPVVELKGYICVRADEIKHTGAIEIPMYQELLSADLVIADLSTANSNAFYELGVRHALRPRTTILMSEELMAYPFDINHISIKKYTHLGESIDYFEVLRFQKELGDTIENVEQTKETDSPVYTFLPDLQAPEMKKMIDAAISNTNNGTNQTAPGEDNTKKTLSYMIAEAESALRKKQFNLAKGLFQTALSLSDDKKDPQFMINDPYLVQRLALCTYKTKDPDYVTSLKNALELLQKIDLDRTNDPETVELAGSIEKHLYEENQGDEHINNAILLYQRGYFLLHNRHNGINLAYLLTLRATTDLDPTRDEKIADLIWANRIRRDVLELCKRDYAKMVAMQNQTQAPANPVGEEQETIVNEQKFWIAVNKAEAHFGLGNLEEYANAVEEANSLVHEDWMMESFTVQLGKLEGLLVGLKEVV